MTNVQYVLNVTLKVNSYVCLSIAVHSTVCIKYCFKSKLIIIIIILSFRCELSPHSSAV